ncbi:MAG TPA: YitT family protein [Candidatus Cryptobacteroides merdipullorum]|uniref:YitT family protein n=1 Tax=Candidatus Cryptobacteroides merdipullorum TaxID=2840771 RepID=A0A9D1GMU8_9BACT|nr:YitT family protein [Candidatus Cryptobacteroides merdipullorum]
MKGKVKTLFKEYLILTIASFIFAAAWECFMIPNGMSAGGMMGLCTIIQYATGDLIPAQVSYIAINAVLMVIAVLAMGIGFGFKTIYCIVVSTLAMGLISGIDALHSVPGEFFYIEEKVLVPIFAGVLEALGIGLILRYGGSTGGSDIVALMINKYWPVSLSTTFLIMDLFICAALLLLPEKNFSDMCYGLEMVVVFSFMVDTVVGGKKSSYQLFVFSDRYKEIADYIIYKMERGVTVLQAQGWYTKKSREVLMILISQKELPSLNKVIKDIDPRAFMSISATNNVYGEGFEEMKTGVKLKKKNQDRDEH